MKRIATVVVFFTVVAAGFLILPAKFALASVTQAKNIKREEGNLLRQHIHDRVTSATKYVRKHLKVETAKLYYTFLNENNAQGVRQAIEAGANVNAHHQHGKTALMKAAARGHVEIVKILLDAQADVNSQDMWGNTALMLAANRGHTEIVELLQEQGASANTRNKAGFTAAHLARQEGNFEIAALLQMQPAY